MPAAEWAEARARMMLDPTVANLNTGSFGLWSRPVFDRVTALRQRLAEEPMDFLIRLLPPLLWEARTRLAHFLNGDPRRMVFTANVTTAINLVASSLTTSGPGEILMTDHEYGAMVWTWERAAARLGLTVRTFPLPRLASDPQEIVDAAAASFSDRTRILFFSHVLSPTGMVLPARELCALARRHGVMSVVDGAHAPAFLPVDLATIGADFYGANCHKWLLAPTGSGFLYLGADDIDWIEPLQVSWGWQQNGNLGPDECDEFGSTPRIRRLEFEGTRDVCPWLVVPEAIDFQDRLGWERIECRRRELSAHVRRRFAFLPLATPENPALCGAMTAFQLPPRLDAQRLRELAWKEGKIEMQIVERPDELLLRVSTPFYVTEDEIDRLADRLPEWMRRAKC
jgi:isopenicillin-N epimerase